jgi:hypothetical protein
MGLMWDHADLLSTMVQKKFVPMPYISKMILQLRSLIWIPSWQSLCPSPCHSAMVDGCLPDSVLQFVECFQHSLKYPFIKANPTIPNHKSSHPEPSRHSCHVKAGHQPWLSLAMPRAMYMTVVHAYYHTLCACSCLKQQWSYPRGDGSLVWTSKKVLGSNPLECRWNSYRKANELDLGGQQLVKLSLPFCAWKEKENSGVGFLGVVHHSKDIILRHQRVTCGTRHSQLWQHDKLTTRTLRLSIGVQKARLLASSVWMLKVTDHAICQECSWIILFWNWA